MSRSDEEGLANGRLSSSGRSLSLPIRTGSALTFFRVCRRTIWRSKKTDGGGALVGGGTDTTQFGDVVRGGGVYA
jgi:hypothetical protein